MKNNNNKIINITNNIIINSGKIIETIKNIVLNIDINSLDDVTNKLQEIFDISEEYIQYVNKYKNKI